MGASVKVQVAAAAVRQPVRRRKEMPGIVVGIDGSRHSTSALEWARRRGCCHVSSLAALGFRAAWGIRYRPA